MNIDNKPSKATPSVAASVSIAIGPGALTGIIVTAASATPTIKIWDSLSAAGTVLIDTFTPVAGTSYFWSPIAFTTGCYITISGTVSCTVLTTR